MPTIGIVGSRRRDSWDDFVLCRKAFKLIHSKGDWIVSGGCPKGGDRFAEILALRLVGVSYDRAWQMLVALRHKKIEELNAPITLHLAKWKDHGRAAGFIRNTYIAEECDVLIALPSDDRTGGTEDTIKKAAKLGRELVLV